MSDLLTALQQQIERLSSTMCQIPGTLFLKAENIETTEAELDFDDVPSLEPVSKRLTMLIDALPPLDLESKRDLEDEIVQLWEQRNALNGQVKAALEELQQIQNRLTSVHEAITIGHKNSQDV